MIAGKFEDQAAATPHKVAVISQGNRLTYLELNRLANRIAHHIERRRPCRPEPGPAAAAAETETLGLLFEHGLDMIAAILATLKAGRAYVPLSADYPKNRLAYMVGHSRSSLILTNSACLETARQLAAQREINCINIDEIDSEVEAFRENLHKPAAGHHLAYIMYTSGSTGRPKGVMQTHENVLYYTRNWQERFAINQGDRMTLFSSFCHDGSVQDMFAALLCGAALYPLNMKNRDNTGELSEFLVKERITIWHSVPSLYTYFVNALTGRPEFKHLRLILLGGEAVREHEINMFRRFFPHSLLANVYGQTESSVNSIWLVHPRDVCHKFVIGEPLDRTEILLVDEEGNEVNPLEIGEIVVSCPHLSPGYWQDPESTDRTFTRDSEIGRLYWTGDLGRRLLNGAVEFIGRKDNQVKVRGFRVEPGEIESHLLRHRHIAEAVVTARQDKGGETYLCAYVAANGSRCLKTTEIREFLARELPDYMVPSFFVWLDRFPLTQSGKIDRQALPEPEVCSTREYVPPRNAVEREMAAAWAGVLGIAEEGIGIDDDFFELGGHSLRATVLISQLHRRLAVAIPLSQVFKTPTIRGLSHWVGRSKQEPYAAIVPLEEKEYYALSSAQKRLYILHRLEPGGIGYNLPLVVSLEGEPDLRRLERSFAVLIGRHESLRTAFITVNEEPVQRIVKEVDFEIEYDGQAEAFVRPFDLSRPPLLRVGVARTDGEKRLLMVDMHHIVSDGTSRLLLMREFIQAMAGEELPAMKVQYRDFVHWQNRLGAAGVMKRQEAFWLDAFADDVPVLHLPTDYPRPEQGSPVGSTIRFELGIEETTEVRRQARQEGVTLYMLLLSAFTIFLSRLSGQEDIVVGTPVAGRRHADLAGIIGMFVNSLCMRNYPRGDATCREFLQDVKERTLEAFENQDYPFEDLVEKVVTRRDIGRNPLFDAALVLQNFLEPPAEAAAEEIEGLKFAPYAFEVGTARFDIMMTVVEVEDGLRFAVEYSSRLFKEETVTRWIVCFKHVLASVLSIAADSRLKISAVTLISEEERRRLLYDFNDTGAHYAGDKTIHGWFEEQAVQTPEHIALVDRHRQVTYRALNRISTQWAVDLSRKGARPDTIVAIMGQRSPETVVGIIAILKTGAAYLPIDPAYPEERIGYMMRDSGAGIVLTPAPPEDNLPAVDSAHPPLKSTCAAGPAYVIYTSGTTGRPKGVLIEHRSVVRLVAGGGVRFGFGGRDVWSLFHSFCFDFSVWEMYGALLYGGKLVIIAKMSAQDTRGFLNLLKEQQVTVLNQTPSAFFNLMDLALADEEKGLCLRCVIFGGEALMPARLKGWQEKYPAVRLVNMYGITETTVHVTFKEINAPDIERGKSTIGKGIPHWTTYVMDRYLHLVPLAVAGELCVGGDGVARGYMNNPELTADKFVNLTPRTPQDTQSPIHKILTPKSYILYRSGDLVRLSAEGELEYLGRIDRQVKVRGFRIELAEIESRLMAHPAVKEAVVIARADKNNDKALYAYIVPHPTNRTSRTSETSPAKLRQYLAESLPDYMVPAYFMQLAQIPLTPNGKVDRKALPEPEIGVGEGYVGPGNEVEEKLAAIWSEVLGIDPETIGIHRSFFEIGGHSLKATILAARIYKELYVNMPLAKIFGSPTIKGMGQFIGRSRGQAYEVIELCEKREYYPVSSMQERMLILNEVEGIHTAYNLLSVWMVEGKLEGQRVETALRLLIRRHESLRTSFAIIDGTPIQRVHDRVDGAVEFFDLVGQEKEPAEIIENFARAFDLSRAPLLRMGSIKLAQERYILMFDVHHIVSDGTSMTILARDLVYLYEGRDRELPPLRVQYKDFARFCRSGPGRRLIDKQEEYWLDRFAGFQAERAMFTDHPRPPVQSFAGERLSFTFEKALTGKIYRLMQQTSATLYMVLLTALNILLLHYTDRQDIVVGTPIAGREHADLENVVGMFVNVLAMRNFTPPDKTFAAFLTEVREHTIRAYENQGYPYGRLVERICPKKDFSRNPLYDVELVVLNMESLIQGEGVAALKVRPYPYDSKTTQVDISIYVQENKEEIDFRLVYCRELYRRQTMERFVDFFKQIVSTAVDQPGIEVKDIRLPHRLERLQTDPYQSAESQFTF